MKEDLQEKAEDLERVKRNAGVDKVQGNIDDLKEVARLRMKENFCKKSQIST